MKTILRLWVSAGTLRGRRWDVITPGLIGREEPPTVMVHLPDDVVSRRHALVLRLGERWGVQDMRSTGGTYLNGVRLEPGVATPLPADGLLQFGDGGPEVAFQIVVEPTPIPPVEPPEGQGQPIGAARGGSSSGSAGFLPPGDSISGEDVHSIFNRALTPSPPRPGRPADPSTPAGLTIQGSSRGGGPLGQVNLLQDNEKSRLANENGRLQKELEKRDVELKRAAQDLDQKRLELEALQKRLQAQRVELEGARKKLAEQAVVVGKLQEGAQRPAEGTLYLAQLQGVTEQLSAQLEELGEELAVEESDDRRRRLLSAATLALGELRSLLQRSRQGS